MCTNDAEERMRELIDLIKEDIEKDMISSATDKNRRALEALEKTEKYFF